ncbi:MAG: PqqD family protein [Clostridia bacterium]|nr:PqqD family protein [Clostridia bacterium]
MKLKGTYVIKEIAGETVAIRVNNDIADLRGAISLKGSAETMFSALLSGAQKEDIVKLLVETYHVPEEAAKNDTEAFLTTLNSNNLLEGYM